jgi:LPPG:FO 2-phospho-L-lactate transferase
VSGGIVVLTGGVGGAKLVLGLTRIAPAREIVAVVNTGDDFRHLGLWVSPDLDTLLYALSGKANQQLGWGREDESWGFMEALASLGGEDWFRLGDRDLALHVLRTAALARGERMSDVTRAFARAWGVEVTMLPMSDDPVATHLDTDEGMLPFQSYFVARRCMPVVRGISFEGAKQSEPAPGVVEAIRSPETRAILIAPSNPYLSIDPILAVPGIREAIAAASAPVVVVSPIIAGEAVKGPTAKLMRELGVEASPRVVAAHYAGLIDGMVIDDRDAGAPPPVAWAATDILMTSLEDRARVAQAALALAGRLAE